MKTSAGDWLLLLGSNQGGRERHLRRALEGLGKIPGSRVLAVSDIHETEPVGPAQGPFLNAAVLLKTGLTPMGLLLAAKRLESEAGREPGPRWGPRPLDIDLIACPGLRLRSRWLSLPHPRAAKRAFVLAPAAQIAPNLRLGNRTVVQLLRRLKPGNGTVKIWRARKSP
ncbi:MAG: 2-amino-4-hydroxy-6-hydroxymethyldihydropteridine diphosphokinase [Elusimicrobiota bacterium]